MSYPSASRRSRGQCVARDPLSLKLEHAYYEIKWLVDVYLIGSLGSQMKSAPQAPVALLGGVLGNGFVELRALHARNVVEFLGSYRKDCISAAQYVTGFALREEVRAALGKLWQQASEQVSHLGSSRVTDAEHKTGTRSKAWPDDRYALLLREAERFVVRLLQTDRLAPSSA
jgi:hypothetical protein